MTEDEKRERQQVIDGFVARLTQIRADAGEPSFRSMAKRSGAISHATLHDAVQGTRFPSWETTAEFAKACGVEPAELREPWESASAELDRGREEAGRVEPSEPEPGPGTAETAQEGTDRVGADVRTDQGEGESLQDQSARVEPAGTASGRRLTAPLIAAIAAAALVLGIGAAFVGNAMFSDEETAPTAEATPPNAKRAEDKSGQTTQPVCRTNTGTYVKQAPKTAADGAALVEDVTMKDCSSVPAGKTMTKTWRYLNRGSVPWKGRVLKRMEPYRGPGDCHTPEEVEVPYTKPGGQVLINVEVKTPTKDTNCFVRWMFMDAEGDYAFPGQRPVFFSVFVR